LDVGVVRSAPPLGASGRLLPCEGSTNLQATRAYLLRSHWPGFFALRHPSAPLGPAPLRGEHELAGHPHVFGAIPPTEPAVETALAWLSEQQCRPLLAGGEAPEVRGGGMFQPCRHRRQAHPTHLRHARLPLTTVCSQRHGWFHGYASMLGIADRSFPAGMGGG